MTSSISGECAHLRSHHQLGMFSQPVFSVTALFSSRLFNIFSRVFGVQGTLMVSDTFCFLEICVSASGLNVMLGFHQFGWHGSMSKQQILDVLSKFSLWVQKDEKNGCTCGGFFASTNSENPVESMDCSQQIAKIPRECISLQKVQYGLQSTKHTN